MIAVIKTGGKQYVVQPGDVLKIEKLLDVVGSAISFETLLIADGDRLEIGTPFLGHRVTGEIKQQGRADKIEVVHYKPKVRYTRRRGHRQPFTEVKITQVQ